MFLCSTCIQIMASNDGYMANRVRNRLDNTWERFIQRLSTFLDNRYVLELNEMVLNRAIAHFIKNLLEFITCYKTGVYLYILKEILPPPDDSCLKFY